MANSSLPVVPQTPKSTSISFIQGTDNAGTYKAAITPTTTPGGICKGICVVSDDAVSHLITMAIQISGTNYRIGVATLATTAGTDGATPPLDMMRGGYPVAGGGATVGFLWPNLFPLDADGNPFFYVDINSLLVFTFTTTISTTGKHIEITPIWVNF